MRRTVLTAASNCYFSHISADDPIVYPGQPGVSHSHTFFGAVTTRPTKASAYFALRAHAMHVEEIVQACFEYTRRCNLPSKS